MIKGVIYDMDDTLVDSNSLHARATTMMLSKYGCDTDRLPKKMVSNFVGRRVKEMMGEIKNYFKIKEELDILLIKNEETFLKIAQEELELLPGARESLKLFQEDGYQIALATSATDKYINLVLDKFAIRDYFEVIVSGDDVQIGKPNPEVFLTTAKKLDLNPGECLVLEDAKNGIEAAKKAGCKCIAIRNDHIPPQDLNEAGMVVDSLEEINKELIKDL